MKYRKKAEKRTSSVR